MADGPGGRSGDWPHRVSFILALAIPLLAIALGSPIPVVLLLLAQAALLVWPRLRSGEGPRETFVVAGATDASPDLRAALDALPSPTILVDRRAIVQHANRAAFGAFPGLRKGFPLSNILRDPTMTEALDSVLRGAEGERAELIERVPVERSFEVSIRRLGSGERTSAAVLHFQDTTQSRRVEQMRADFVANASHELRTPLASVLGFVETLQGPAKNDAAARERFLGIIAEQARRMTRLINDLLSLSRIEMRAHIPPSEPVDLRPLVLHLFDLLGGLAAERKVKLEGDLPEDGDFVVPGERDELVRLFENLIENAIKYGSAGGKVRVTLARREGEVVLEVRDFGPGIAAEHLPRLTERFYRISAAESREQGGTGLGLAICKHIVTRHRGRLELASPERAGLIVTVLLPSYKAA
ncbi:MAG: two-component sensor histidine kinase [Methylobacterium sp.]|nr:two-component sensor histidine kinase [Methylobacterium sp.]MCA3651724.1 two-component sensor histidine kinase [Methylobacterium sp.]